MKITPKSTLLMMFALFVAFPNGARSQNFESIFEVICTGSVVTKELAVAIAKHESTLEPLALNIAGKSFFPKSLEEAKNLIAHATKNKQSYDVGLLQINSYWINRWGIDPESLLDPSENLRAGIKILSSTIAQHGFSWQAVGAYHSPNPERARQYAWKIFTTVHGGTQKTLEKIEVAHAKQEKSTQKLLLRRGNQGHNGTSSSVRIIRF